jgi:hypothetical protein
MFHFGQQVLILNDCGRFTGGVYNARRGVIDAVKIIPITDRPAMTLVRVKIEGFPDDPFLYGKAWFLSDEVTLTT